MGHDAEKDTFGNHLKELEELSRKISRGLENPSIDGKLKDHSRRLNRIIQSLNESEEKRSQAQRESGKRFEETRQELRTVQRLFQQSEEKFSKAFNLGPVIITLSTVDEGRYVEVSDYFLRTTEYTKGEVIGHTSLDLGIWANLEDRERVIRTLKETGRVVDEEILFRSKSGRIYNMLYFAEVVSMGNVAYLVSVAIDITMRKQAEDALKQSDAPAWAAAEWLYQGPGETGPWRRAIGNTLADPRCRFLSIFNWEGIRTNERILNAIRQALAGGTSDEQE